MFHIPLSEITLQHVEDFCRTWAEGVRVEYTQAIPQGQIPKIISSFANTLGGIWRLGVEADKRTNMPIFPLQGMPNQPGIEERISQSCWTGIYPPVTLAVRPIALAADPTKVIVVVKVPESIEAPHAIENTTRVYIRNASTTEPIELAEIDRIEYLLNRRREPGQRREQMIATAMQRAVVKTTVPRIRIMIGPKYPYRPLFSREALDQRLRDLRMRGVIPWTMRRIQQGLVSVQEPSTYDCFEVNIYGLICCI